MYVCVCHALTDRQVRQHAIVAESIAALYRALGVRPACGKCVPLVRTILDGSQPARADFPQTACAVTQPQ